MQYCNGNALDHAQKKKNVPLSKSLFIPFKYALASVGLIGGKSAQQKRHCFHPGASNLGREGIGFKDAAPITGKQMMTAMFGYIWPKVGLLQIIIFSVMQILIFAPADSQFFLQEDKEIKNRVKLAIGLLIGAKLLNVCVPFLFKYGIDTFNTAGNLGTPPETVATVATSVLIGCKIFFKLII